MRYISIGKLWLRPALAQSSAVQSIVYLSEDCYNQRVQIYDRPPSGEHQTFPLEGLVTWTFNFQRTKTCTWG